MKSTAIRDRILVALLSLSRKSGFAEYPLAMITDEAKLTLSPGFDELLLNQFLAAELVALSDEAYDDNDVPHLRLNWQGIQAAEALLDLHPEYGVGLAPTSSGYVSIAHNQTEPIKSDLHALSEGIRGANEVEEEARLRAISEIAAFEQTIIQPRVSTELIQRFVDRILHSITQVFSSAVLHELAQRLIQALSKLM